MSKNLNPKEADPIITPEPKVPVSTAEPIDLMNQKDSVASKSKGATTDDIIKSFSQSVTNLENAINKLLSPKAPDAPIITDTPPVKKSWFKQLDDDLNKWMES